MSFRTASGRCWTRWRAAGPTSSSSATRSGWASCRRRRSGACSAMSRASRTSASPAPPTSFISPRWVSCCASARGPSRWSRLDGDGLKPLVAAFAFLTRLPVWRGPLRDVDLGRSVSFFPLVGLVLGFGLTGLAAALAGHLAPGICAVLLAALLAGLTGGLHLDGFADVFDALGGGRGDRVRMLEIMRDSRIGAHGAAALILLLIAKVAALAQVIERHDLLALLAFPMIGRWLAALLVVLFPYVRAEGLGRAFNGEAGRVQIA